VIARLDRAKSIGLDNLRALSLDAPMSCVW
jgi:hypothetical protein